MTQRKPPPSSEYRIAVSRLDGLATAFHGDEILAESRNARVMYETRLPATVYFPLSDIRAELIDCDERRTFCPFKGTASYMDVVIAGKTIPAAAWTYANALPEAGDIEGYIGFMPNALTRLDIPSGRVDDVMDGHISGPTIDWMMRGAWTCSTPEELTAAVARKFVEDGIAVSRLSVLIWSLHPQIAGRNYIWTRQADSIETRTPSHDLLVNPAYINSPLRLVSNGQGGVRQSLLSERAEFSFPIMEDLKAGGGTDYVAMPLPFSNGQINVLTLTCDHPRGFTTANLGLVFESASVLSRYYEVFAQKENASALLETYLGRRTGARVLGGEIRRGDGDEIDAAVLFCDLRHSTRLENELGRHAYLELLNRFFELTTDVVNAFGGEVLKFVGDAVLAIFPVTREPSGACRQALQAALDIHKQISAIDTPNGAFECVIGLAFGNVTYGNVGSRERLDFTVIGAPANIAARFSELGKTLGEPIVAGLELAAANAVSLRSLGVHALKNVGGDIEAFAPQKP